MTHPLTSAQREEYTAFLHTLADVAAEITLSNFKRPINVLNKGRKLRLDYDPVTEADRQAEQAIRRLISHRYPADNILGEELGEKLGEELGSKQTNAWIWIIDPIDGTRAYICGIPTWGTLIALNDGIKPIMGLMDQPYLRERYIGTPEGAFLNGNRINCRHCTRLSEATVSTTDPTQFFATEKDGEAFRRVAAQARLVRNGYDCYGYAMIAAGFIDVVIESGLEPYDIQALIPLIEGAGGHITDWQGNPACQGGQVVASATAALHQQVLALLNT